MRKGGNTPIGFVSLESVHSDRSLVSEWVLAPGLWVTSKVGSGGLFGFA